MTVEEAIKIVIGAMRDPFSSVYTPAVGALQFLEKEARLAQRYKAALEECTYIADHVEEYYLGGKEVVNVARKALEEQQ